MNLHIFLMISYLISYL